MEAGSFGGFKRIFFFLCKLSMFLLFRDDTVPKTGGQGTQVMDRGLLRASGMAPWVKDLLKSLGA